MSAWRRKGFSPELLVLCPVPVSKAPPVTCSQEKLTAQQGLLSPEPVPLKPSSTPYLMLGPGASLVTLFMQP